MFLYLAFFITTIILFHNKLYRYLYNANQELNILNNIINISLYYDFNYMNLLFLICFIFNHNLLIFIIYYKITNLVLLRNKFLHRYCIFNIIDFIIFVTLYIFLQNTFHVYIIGLPIIFTEFYIEFLQIDN